MNSEIRGVSNMSWLKRVAFKLLNRGVLIRATRSFENWPTPNEQHSSETASWENGGACWCRQTLAGSGEIEGIGI
jgi:hypothetical protein